MLVTMPHAQVMRPSIALGILKASLLREGISCRVDYANLRFAETVGLEINSFLMQLPEEGGIVPVIECHGREVGRLNSPGASENLLEVVSSVTEGRL